MWVRQPIVGARWKPLWKAVPSVWKVAKERNMVDPIVKTGKSEK
jgi:hypothetical protein